MPYRTWVTESTLDRQSIESLKSVTREAVNSGQDLDGDLDPNPNQAPIEVGNSQSPSPSSSLVTTHGSLPRLEELLLVIEERISVRRQGHLKWEECLENFVQRLVDGSSLQQTNRMNLKLSSLTNLDPE